MAGISTRLSSAWQHAQAWRQKRRAMIDDFRSNADTAASGLGNAVAAQISGRETLVSQVVMGRLQAEAKAKVARAASLTSSVNQLV